LPPLRCVGAVVARLLHERAEVKARAKTAVAEQARNSAISGKRAKKRARLELQRAATILNHMRAWEGEQWGGGV